MRIWKRFVCRIKGHDWEPVAPVIVMVVPDAGPIVGFNPDPDGKVRACNRCRTVDLGKSDLRPEDF